MQFSHNVHPMLHHVSCPLTQLHTGSSTCMTLSVVSLLYIMTVLNSILSFVYEGALLMVIAKMMQLPGKELEELLKATD